jgi:protein SCO1/2
MSVTPLLVALFLAGPRAEPAGRLAVIRPAPDFALTSQDERQIKFSDYRGKIVLVSFVFTTCNGTCPATTHRLAVVQQRLQKHEQLRDEVHFVSISLDPERDTPEVLRGYMRLYDLPAKNWTFLTGAAKEVAAVHEAWGMWVKPAANGQLDHPSRVFLVDTRGRIREIYNLDFLRLPWVMEDLQLLRREP